MRSTTHNAHAGVKGKCVTLKVMQRQEGAPAPYKFLGHGACDSHSRSVTLGASTDQPDDVLRVCWELFQALKLPPADVRGVGISVRSSCGPVRLGAPSAARSAGSWGLGVGGPHPLPSARHSRARGL